jgi:Bacterial protein of unknown function (DUF916)
LPEEEKGADLFNAIRREAVMRILYSFMGRRVFFCGNIAVFMVALSLLLSGSFPVVHAADGQSAFDMTPAFPDPHNLVTGSYFVLDGRPATRLQNSIRVTNVGSASGTVTLYPVDAFTATTGGIAFHARTDARLTVGAWIMLKHQQLTLTPGASQIVPFQLTIPGYVRSSQYVGGIVADDTVPQALTSSLHIGMQHLRIIAVQVDMPDKPNEKLVVTGIRLDDANSSQGLLIALSNTGNTMVKASGELQIFDRSKHLVSAQALQVGTFLPQTTINYPASIQCEVLPIGHYKATLTLTYGHKQRLSYTTMFTSMAPKKTVAKAISTPVSQRDSKGFFNPLSPWLTVRGGGLLLVICGLSFRLYKLFMGKKKRVW